MYTPFKQQIISIISKFEKYWLFNDYKYFLKNKAHLDSTNRQSCYFIQRNLKEKKKILIIKLSKFLRRF